MAVRPPKRIKGVEYLRAILRKAKDIARERDEALGVGT